MAKMTKADIQKRQLEIMTKMDEMDSCQPVLRLSPLVPSSQPSRAARTRARSCVR